MASKIINSSSVFRSALALHAGLTAASLLRAAAFSNNDEQLLLSQSPSVDTDTALDALPWLHQLHNVVVDLYSSGKGMTTARRPTTIDRNYYGERASGPPLSSSSRNDVPNVRLSNNTIFEDPFVRHVSATEIERSFRGNMIARPWVNVETVLDCIGVEATEDSICGGSGGGGGGISNNDTHPPSAIISNDATRQQYHPLLVGIIPPSAPKVVVIYRLSQRYGTYLSPFHSIVRVTVQCQNRGCSEQEEQLVRHLSSRRKGSREPTPLATSSSSTVASTTFSPRSITRIIVAIVATAQSNLTLALARVANEISTTSLPTTATTERGGGTSCHSSDGDDTGHSNKIDDDTGQNNNENNLPLVVEIVRMEELWNGVQLIYAAPFHWSRRLNGLVIGCFAYIFCD